MKKGKDTERIGKKGRGVKGGGGGGGGGRGQDSERRLFFKEYTMIIMLCTSMNDGQAASIILLQNTY